MAPVEWGGGAKLKDFHGTNADKIRQNSPNCNWRVSIKVCVHQRSGANRVCSAVWIEIKVIREFLCIVCHNNYLLIDIYRFLKAAVSHTKAIYRLDSIWDKIITEIKTIYKTQNYHRNWCINPRISDLFFGQDRYILEFLFWCTTGTCLYSFAICVIAICDQARSHWVAWGGLGSQMRPIGNRMPAFYHPWEFFCNL